MKRAAYYISVLLIITILLPLIIVKCCGNANISKPKQGEGLKIKVYINEEKKIQEMDLEEYVKGVVAAEMPAGFEQEALDAQAVAARTYAFSRMKKIYSANDGKDNGADICTDPGHCQAWISKQTAMKRWGIFSSLKYWNKIEKAVDDTQNIIIVYNNTIVNPVFHSNSGGRTENSEDVWAGVYVPYLRSVESDGEDVTTEFRSSVIIEISEFIDKLKSEYADIKINGKDIMKDVKTIDYTAGGSVKTIKIGNHIIKGTDFRSLFSLKSAKFTIEENDKKSLKITTLGNGHGVGMSQWGANHLAKLGENYEDIIKYYYKGVELSTVDKF